MVLGKLPKSNFLNHFLDPDEHNGLPGFLAIPQELYSELHLEVQVDDKFDQYSSVFQTIST